MKTNIKTTRVGRDRRRGGAGVGVEVVAIKVLGRIKMVGVEVQVQAMANITTIVTGKTIIMVEILTESGRAGTSATRPPIILCRGVRCLERACHRWNGTSTTHCMCLGGRRFTRDSRRMQLTPF